MLTRLRIRKFKRFEDADIELGDVEVLESYARKLAEAQPADAVEIGTG